MEKSSRLQPAIHGDTLSHNTTQLSIVPDDFNPRTQEAEAGRSTKRPAWSTEVIVQPGLHSEILCENILVFTTVNYLSTPSGKNSINCSTEWQNQLVSIIHIVLPLTITYIQHSAYIYM